MLDFCAERGIVSDIEIIPIQKINEAYERPVEERREVPLRDRHVFPEINLDCRQRKSPPRVGLFDFAVRSIYRSSSMHSSNTLREGRVTLSGNVASGSSVISSMSIKFGAVVFR